MLTKEDNEILTRGPPGGPPGPPPRPAPGPPPPPQGAAGGALPQDQAMTESMGPIYDRTKEHLGTTDQAIIYMRRLLINAAKELAGGGEPAGVGPALPPQGL